VPPGGIPVNVYGLDPRLGFVGDCKARLVGCFCTSMASQDSELD
jgi:hypothetical protein